MPVIIFRRVSFGMRSGCTCFNLSLRDVEDLMAERGFDISYETIRRWVVIFGTDYARTLRRRRPARDDRWHLGEMFVSIVTDKLRSYGAALGEFGLAKRHETGSRLNNRAENSHQPLRRRERSWIGFKRPGLIQRFLSAHAAIYNCFNLQRHLISRRTLRIFRDAAFAEWRTAVQVA